MDDGSGARPAQRMSMDASVRGGQPRTPHAEGAEAEEVAEAEEARLRAGDQSLDLVEQLLEAYFMQACPAHATPPPRPHALLPFEPCHLSDWMTGGAADASLSSPSQARFCDVGRRPFSLSMTSTFDRLHLLPRVRANPVTYCAGRDGWPRQVNLLGAAGLHEPAAGPQPHM